MSSDRRATTQVDPRAATVLRHKRMISQLGDADDEGVGSGDIRAMARMHHTGVPIVDIAYIYGVTPSFVRRCVWRFVWHWLGAEDSPDGDVAQDGNPDIGDKGIPCGLP